MTTRLTTRGRIAGVTGCGLVLTGVLLGVLDLTRIGVLLIALVLIARLLVGRRVELVVDRQVDPPTVPPGDPVMVTLGLRNTGRATTPLLQAEEGVAYALGDRPRLLVPRVGHDEVRQVRYPVRSHVRGRHRIGPLTVRASDPFGLAAQSGALSGTAGVTVLPRTMPLAGLPRTRLGAGGDDVVTAQITLHGESDVGVREYRQGDDLRRIHWPSTARTGSMMVRQDDQPSRRRALVLLDNRLSGHVGTGGGGSFEWAVSAAASICVHLLAHEIETYLATSDPGEHAFVPLQSMDETLQALAVVEQCQVGGADALLEATTDLFGIGGAMTIAVVGPLTHEESRGICSTGSGLAMVIDPDCFTEDAARSSETTQRLLDGGWRAVNVRPGSRVEQLWSDLVAVDAAMTAGAAR